MHDRPEDDLAEFLVMAFEVGVGQIQGQGIVVGGQLVGDGLSLLVRDAVRFFASNCADPDGLGILALGAFANGID